MGKDKKPARMLSEFYKHLKKQEYSPMYFFLLAMADNEVEKRRYLGEIIIPHYDSDHPEELQDQRKKFGEDYYERALKAIFDYYGVSAWAAVLRAGSKNHYIPQQHNELSSSAEKFLDFENDDKFIQTKMDI